MALPLGSPHLARRLDRGGRSVANALPFDLHRSSAEILSKSKEKLPFGVVSHVDLARKAEGAHDRALSSSLALGHCALRCDVCADADGIFRRRYLRISYDDSCAQRLL